MEKAAGGSSRAQLLTSKKVVAKLGVSLRCLQAWDRAGITHSIKEGSRRKRLYGFRDLIQIAIIRNLRGEGVSLKTIAIAIEKIRNESSMPETPLVNLCIATDGKGIFIKESGKVWDLVTGQGELFNWPFKDILSETSKVIPLPPNINNMRLRELFLKPIIQQL